MVELTQQPPDVSALVSRDRRRFVGYLVIGAICVLNVVRACLQSVTIDEASTYIDFVARGEAYIRSAFHSNNHTLHSLLVWFSTEELGLSHLSLRLPALVGGLIYLFACEWLVRSSCHKTLTYILALLALTANPFVLDYMVASRGYGLALGCFMAAAAFCLFEIQPRASRASGGGGLWRYGLISLLCCFSVAANLSFAFANTSLLVVFLAWTVIAPLLAPFARKAAGREGREIERKEKSVSKWRWATGRTLALVAPGGWLYLQINPAITQDYNRDTLYFGVNSWGEVYKGLTEPLFRCPNPMIIGGAWREVWIEIADWLIVFLAAVVALFVAMVLAPSLLKVRGREDELDGLTRNWLFIASTLLLTLTLHQFGRWLMGIPLPLERTGLFIVSLSLLLICFSVEGLMGTSWRNRWPSPRGAGWRYWSFTSSSPCARTIFICGSSAPDRKKCFASRAITAGSVTSMTWAWIGSSTQLLNSI